MPAIAQIIMICDETECVRALNLDARQLGLVILRKGGGCAVTQQRIIVQQYTDIWNEGSSFDGSVKDELA